MDQIQNKKLAVGRYGISLLTNTAEDDSVYDGFMMVMNNYYSLKVFDLSNSDLKEIKIWFRDGFGEIIPIIKSYRPEDTSDIKSLDDYEKL
jgi:hypothetical protein